eukprot:CAMPEP_0177668198 /NCGR_PEP_ID=MMETSP0447-20121125/22610_1 /TAXON_ID=0 /ORGANISM="Stygamoeba regulata, Strain BSH-02190019" /LENGTH=614 /DNA_ID=CAMNT_0019174643 /DNA_START=257 /DNA_END=2101 /DNA_ORIENTATION=+
MLMNGTYENTDAAHQFPAAFSHPVIIRALMPDTVTFVLSASSSALSINTCSTAIGSPSVTASVEGIRFTLQPGSVLNQPAVVFHQDAPTDAAVTEELSAAAAAAEERNHRVGAPQVYGGGTSARIRSSVDRSLAASDALTSSSDAAAEPSSTELLVCSFSSVHLIDCSFAAIEFKQQPLVGIAAVDTVLFESVSLSGITSVNSALFLIDQVSSIRFTRLSLENVNVASVASLSRINSVTMQEVSMDLVAVSDASFSIELPLPNAVFSLNNLTANNFTGNLLLCSAVAQLSLSQVHLNGWPLSSNQPLLDITGQESCAVSVHDCIFELDGSKHPTYSAEDALLRVHHCSVALARITQLWTQGSSSLSSAKSSSQVPPYNLLYADGSGGQQLNIQSSQLTSAFSWSLANTVQTAPVSSIDSATLAMAGYTVLVEDSVFSRLNVTCAGSDCSGELLSIQVSRSNLTMEQVDIGSMQHDGSTITRALVTVPSVQTLLNATQSRFVGPADATPNTWAAFACEKSSMESDISPSVSASHSSNITAEECTFVQVALSETCDVKCEHCTLSTPSGASKQLVTIVSATVGTVCIVVILLVILVSAVLAIKHRRNNSGYLPIVV